ncbi:MAG: deoxyribose-phosphate aldolase [Tannerellaceae bacterium]|nr:deoxyribose-phosphate aldolase [Tannerellaceae bacterium]
MKNLNLNELSKLIDISAVRADSTYDEVRRIVECAKVHQFICVFPMPGFIHETVSMLKDHPDIRIGGVVGFPSGAENEATKLYEARERKEAGCHEIDMVMNIGYLKSGRQEEVLQEIHRIKETVHPLPLKVIIEVSLLSDEEIRNACQLVVAAGADYVKTGTGWAGPTTMHHVRLIKSTIGDQIKLKVAGGIRDLATLEEMYLAGVSRFGIGYKSVINILEEYKKRTQHG